MHLQSAAPVVALLAGCLKLISCITDVERQQAAFISGKGSIERLKLFETSDSFSKHTGALFSKMTGDHMARFLEHIGSLKKGAITGFLRLGNNFGDEDYSYSTEDSRSIEDSRSTEDSRNTDDSHSTNDSNSTDYSNTTDDRDSAEYSNGNSNEDSISNSNTFINQEMNVVNSANNPTEGASNPANGPANHLAYGPANKPIHNPTKKRVYRKNHSKGMQAPRGHKTHRSGKTRQSTRIDQRTHRSNMQYILNQMDMGRAKSFLSQIDSKKISLLADSQACQLLSLVLDQFRPDTLNGLSWNCANALLGALISKKHANQSIVGPKENLYYFPRFHLKEHSSQIAKLAGRKLHLLSPDQIGLVLAGNANCGWIDARTLPKLDSKQAKKISSKCFAKIRLGLTKVKTIDAEMWDNFSDTILEWSQQELGEGFWKDIPEAKLSHLGAQLKTDRRCSNLNLPLIPDESLRAIQPNCFQGYVRSYGGKAQGGKRYSSSTAIEGLAERWVNFSDDILSGIQSDLLPAVLKSIPNEDWDGIQMSQLSPLLENDLGCNHLPESIVLKSPTNVSVSCFAKLKGPLQTQILAKGTNLSDKLLSKVTISMVKHWSWEGKRNGRRERGSNKRGRNDSDSDSDGNDKRLVGLEVLELLQDQPNVEALLANLSTNVPISQHACRIVSQQSSAVSVKKLELLVAFANKECLEILEKAVATIKMDKLVKSPVLLALRPFKAVKEFVNDDWWKNITADRLSKMVSVHDGRICKELDAKIFHSLPKESLQAIDGNCAAKLTFLPEILEEEWTAMGDDAFAQFDANKFLAATKLSWPILRGPQLEFMSEEVEMAIINEATTASPKALAKPLTTASAKIALSPSTLSSPASAFTLLDNEAMKKLDGMNQLAYIAKDSWTFIPPKAFSGMVLPEQLRAIPADNMTEWNLEQVQKIPLETLVKGLTKEQATLIGTYFEAKAELEDPATGSESGPKASKEALLKSNSPIPYLKGVAAKMKEETRKVLDMRNAANGLISSGSLGNILWMLIVGTSVTIMMI